MMIRSYLILWPFYLRPPEPVNRAYCLTQRENSHEPKSSPAEGDSLWGEASVRLNWPS